MDLSKPSIRLSAGGLIDTFFCTGTAATAKKRSAIPGYFRVAEIFPEKAKWVSHNDHRKVVTAYCSATVGDFAMCTLFVAYFRVSTEKLVWSGEAQQEARAFIATKCAADAKLIANYAEIESGKRGDRMELAKVANHAKLTDARLDAIDRQT